MAILKPEQRNTWFTIPNQSLSIYMREAGFDLAIYDQYSEAVREEARRDTIKKAMYSLEWAFWELTGAELKHILHGVYVIRLSGGIEVKYEKGTSPVIYIGEGAVANRLKSHYDKKLFDFMASLSGVNFDFLVCEPWKKHHRGANAHRQVENLLLREFALRYGGLEGGNQYPLMNKISGSEHGFEMGSDWWKYPLQRYGRKPLWEIKPIERSGFEGALD